MGNNRNCSSCDGDKTKADGEQGGKGAYGGGGPDRPRSCCNKTRDSCDTTGRTAFPVKGGLGVHGGCFRRPPVRREWRGPHWREEASPADAQRSWPPSFACAVSCRCIRWAISQISRREGSRPAQKHDEGWAGGRKACLARAEGGGAFRCCLLAEVGWESLRLRPTSCCPAGATLREKYVAKGFFLERRIVRDLRVRAERSRASPSLPTGASLEVPPPKPARPGERPPSRQATAGPPSTDSDTRRPARSSPGRPSHR